MASIEAPADALARVVGQAGGKARLSDAVVAPSTLYDASYHQAIVACAFRIHASTEQRVLAPWLKLLQFVAARPHLESVLREFIAERGKEGSLWHQMPRGYIGDQTHDQVVDYLVATGVVTYEKGDLVAGANFARLTTLADAIIASGTFATERQVLESMKTVKISKVILSGR